MADILEPQANTEARLELMRGQTCESTLPVKTTAVLGPNAEMCDVQEAIHLNRLLNMYLPEHKGANVEILMSQVGLGDVSKAVSTLGVRMTDEDDGKELDAERRACYRS